MDVVITYVNCNENFIQEYEKYVQKELEVERYRSYDTLDLQIKLIRKYLPFVKNIFVIVSNKEQIEGIDTSDAIIITHEDIIPSKYLPCFNSCTIEMFFHKIPNLSEEFIYFNDDVFPIDYLKPTDFFIYHKPLYNPKTYTLEKDNDKLYLFNLNNSTVLAAKILRKENDYKDKYIKYAHSTIPLLKSSYELTWQFERNQILASLTRTRHRKNYNTTLFNNYNYLLDKFIHKDVRSTYLNLASGIDKIIDTILYKPTPIVCINDVGEYSFDFDTFKKELRKAFEMNLLDTQPKKEIVKKEEPKKEKIKKETSKKEEPKKEETKKQNSIVQTIKNISNSLFNKEIKETKEEVKENKDEKPREELVKVSYKVDKEKEIETPKEEVKEEIIIKPPLKVALCAIAKNENLYIREWVDWYKNLGISKIFLYDNNDIDGERFEDVINDYIEDKFIEIIDRRGITKTVSTDKDGQTLQGLAFQDCFYNHYKEFDYMCFFDIDEYLEIYNTYKDLNDFLHNFDEFDGIRVQWKMYGDNDELYYENKSLYKRFKKESNASYDRHVKQILNCNKKFDEKLLFCAHGVFNKKYKFVNVNKELVKNVYMDLIAHDNLSVFLNHFFSKSTEEFFKRKYNKPSAVTGINNKRNFNIDFLKNQYFEHNKKTEEKERFINIFINSNNSVNVYMASLYKDGHVIESIKSIIKQPQVKSLILSANNYTDEQYEKVIKEINSTKLIIYRTNNEKLSFEKLRFVNNDISTKYVAFCDDDLIFYDGYFRKMISECELLDAVVSYHGGILKKPLPIEHYYPDRKSFSFNRDVRENKEVDIIGNGVSLFKRDWITYKQWKDLYNNAPEVSMDDITVSYTLRKNGKKLIVVKHSTGDVIERKNNNDTVYTLYKKNDSIQTDWVNKYFISL